jgi:hypothetical protein
MNTPNNSNQLNAQNELFAELENELHIEELEERLEMTTDGGGGGGSVEPPKLPWPVG